MTRRIEKAAVIGSGIMGGGIAALCASAGIKTLLLDIAPFDLKDEEKNDRAAKNRIVEAGLQAQIKAKPAAFMDKKHDIPMIETGNLTDDFDKLKDCDIIFEVVVENLKIKQDLYAKIEKVRKPDSIIAFRLLTPMLCGFYAVCKYSCMTWLVLFHPRILRG